MTTTDLAPVQSSPLVALNEVKQYLCPNATDSEAYMFIRFCQSYNLNPFIRDAYLLKYDANAPASIVIGKDAIIRRCQDEDDYRGFEAGVVVSQGSETKEIEGAIIPNGATLIGGWCQMHREGFTYGKVRVSMAEYDRKQSSWKSMPATMIRKVAVVQAHREAYPGLTAGMYDAAEMPVAIEGQGSRSTSTNNGTPGSDLWCPVHDVAFEWRDGKGGKPGWYSHKDGTGWCNGKQAFKARLEELCKLQGVGAEEIGKWIKDNYGTTWSKLTELQMAEVVQRVDPDNQPEAEAATDDGDLDFAPESDELEQAPVA